VGRSRRSWGWYRLDPAVAGQLAADANLPIGALVLDIGAGEGAITLPLVEAGARVVAIEANRGRAARLGDLVGDRVKVVRVDAEEMYLPRRPFHVVANPPYSITSCLVPLLLQPGSRLVRAHLVLQRQAAARWCDAVNSTPRRARRFDAHLGRRIARRSFDPPPKVDSRVLVIERRSRRH
jgi:23S rRNA (adenine-N6)-dimethyltransferase